MLQSQCPRQQIYSNPTHKSIKGETDEQNVVHTYNRMLVGKNVNKVLPNATWIMPPTKSEMGQTKRDKYRFLFSAETSRNRRLQTDQK